MDLHYNIPCSQALGSDYEHDITIMSDLRRATEFYCRLLRYKVVLRDGTGRPQLVGNLPNFPFRLWSHSLICSCLSRCCCLSTNKPGNKLLYRVSYVTLCLLMPLLHVSHVETRHPYFQTIRNPLRRNPNLIARPFFLLVWLLRDFLKRNHIYRDLCNIWS